jgi:predicted ATPase
LQIITIEVELYANKDELFFPIVSDALKMRCRVYIYGGVGTGKSLVADIFFHCSPIQGKRRVHFHQFMLDIHKR